jgi:RNA polymerase sigma-70 factor (ECF subfamily)
MANTNQDRAREQRFGALFEDTFAPIASFVRRRMPEADVDDIVAEVFFTAWRHFDTIETLDERGPLAWLYRTAANAVANSRRGTFRRQRLHDRLALLREGDANQPVPIFEPLDEFTNAFDSLSSADQEALRLTIWDGLGSAEAAAIIGCSRGAFQVRIHRARARLRRLLERDDVICEAEQLQPTKNEQLPFTLAVPLSETLNLKENS